MRSSKRRGLSLIETIAAASILILIMSIVVAVMRSGQKTQAETQSVVSLTGDVLAGVRQLRKDLETTSLTSVAVFESPPSCSMAVVDGKKPVTDFGTPAWNGHIYYTLEPSEKVTTKLLRWTQKESKADGFPRASKQLPWEIPEPSKPSVSIKNLLSPAWTIEQGQQGFEAVRKQGDGGFQVRFVRKAVDGQRSLSTDNPTLFNDNQRRGWSEGNTPLLQVNLVVTRSERSRLSAVKFDLRVAPRN